MPLLSFLDENRGNIIGGTTFSCLVNVFLFQFKVHRCSAIFFFFLGQKHRRALNFRLDLLTKKGKAGQCLVHNIFDAKCLQVKFTLS